MQDEVYGKTLDKAELESSDEIHKNKYAELRLQALEQKIEAICNHLDIYIQPVHKKFDVINKRKITSGGVTSALNGETLQASI